MTNEQYRQSLLGLTQAELRRERIAAFEKLYFSNLRIIEISLAALRKFQNESVENVSGLAELKAETEDAIGLGDFIIATLGYDPVTRLG